MDFKKGDKVTFNRNETWVIEWLYTSNVIISRKRKDLKEELMSSSTAKRDLKIKGVKCKTNYLYLEVKKSRIRIFNLKKITISKFNESYN